MIKNLKNKKKKGFTLIELIIVIAIIAILAAIAIPQFSNIRKKANINTDVANARTISSIIAAEVADEKIDPNVKTLTKVDGLNGNLDPVPVPKAYKGTGFFYKVTDGSVEIYVAKTSTDGSATGTALEIYPERDDNYGNGSEPAVKTSTFTNTGN